MTTRRPRKRECRSFPCAVHSMNATCTTMSGRTQWARKRGSPTARVKGGSGISSASSRARSSRRSFRIETRAHLPREDEVAALERADEKRSQADSSALRLGEAAHNEIPRQLAFHLQPVGRSPLFVERVSPLGDDALPPLAARPCPGLTTLESGDAPQGRAKVKISDESAPLIERQRGEVSAIEPHHVEHMVGDWPSLSPYSGRLAVENDLADRKRFDSLGYFRIRRVLGKPVARQQAHVASFLEREETYTVELALENPLRSLEALLGERRGHRLDPVGKIHVSSSGTATSRTRGPKFR